MSDHLDQVDSLLRELASDLRTPEPGPHLEAAVLARITAATPRTRPRRRWVAVVVLALLLGGLAVSPVGAKVLDWLDFHGVMVRDGDSGLDGTPVVPSVAPSASAALSRASFDPLLPASLGTPDGIDVSGDGRLVSLSWTQDGATIRVDEFEGDLDPLFWKTSPDAEGVEVAGREALWFPTPHEVVVVPGGGKPETHPPRLAAQTLVVPWAGVTVRIEGSFDRASAVRIASSLEPWSE